MGASGWDSMLLCGIAGAGVGSGTTLPVRLGSPEPDEKGLENGALAKRSVEQAAVIPPTIPMIANREAARINSAPSFSRITHAPDAKLTDLIKGPLGLSIR